MGGARMAFLWKCGYCRPRRPSLSRCAGWDAESSSMFRMARLLSRRDFSSLPQTSSSSLTLQKAHAMLGVDQSTSKEELKERFIALAKRHHPDACEQGNEDSSKFVEIRNAYELIVKERDTEEKDELEKFAEETEHDIKHTAPQHRVYLEYGGFGVGTPSQRQKQYQQNRAARASTSSVEYLIDKRIKESEQMPKEGDLTLLNVTKEQAYFANKQKSTNAIERIVEDLILRAMNNGDFSNLKGTGKPLKFDNENPYIDSIEFKINKILINNGFSPPWLMKDVEIRNEIKALRDEIRLEYARYKLSNEKQFRSYISKESSDKRWKGVQEKVGSRIALLNKAVHDYNLVAPSLRMQLFPLCLADEVARAVRDVDCSNSENVWNERAKKSLNFVIANYKSDTEGLFAQFVNAVIGLRNL